MCNGCKSVLGAAAANSSRHASARARAPLHLGGRVHALVPDRRGRRRAARPRRDQRDGGVGRRAPAHLHELVEDGFYDGAAFALCQISWCNSELRARRPRTKSGRRRSRTTRSCSPTSQAPSRTRRPARIRGPHSSSSTCRTMRASTARALRRSDPSSTAWTSSAHLQPDAGPERRRLAERLRDQGRRLDPQNVPADQLHHQQQPRPQSPQKISLNRPAARRLTLTPPRPQSSSPPSSARRGTRRGCPGPASPTASRGRPRPSCPAARRGTG